MAATVGAFGLAIGLGVAPAAWADTTVVQSPGNAQISVSPGPAAGQAAQLQQPFGGYGTALLFHHR
jgi:hypothetical protein